MELVLKYINVIILFVVGLVLFMSVKLEEKPAQADCSIDIKQDNRAAPRSKKASRRRHSEKQPSSTDEGKLGSSNLFESATKKLNKFTEERLSHIAKLSKINDTLTSLFWQKM
jgi:hypothetical protein